MSGAGIMLMVGNQPHTSVCTTDGVSALIEELQYTLGEGPCVDAYRLGLPVLEPDLGSAARRPLAGVHPTQPSPVVPGPCSGSRCRSARFASARSTSTATGPGPLTTEQHTDASILAAVAGRACDRDADRRRAGHARRRSWKPAATFRLVVHQATGMVAEQLGISVTEALIRLRAHAFTQDRPLTDVANDVVAGRLRFGRGPATRGSLSAR